MNLGIAGRRAIVGASSRGLGYACARALALEGVHVVLNGRNAASLQAAVSALRAEAGSDIDIVEVAGDNTASAGLAALRAACPEPDILILNTGGPPVRRFSAATREEWGSALESGMLAQLQLVSAFLPAMRRRKFGRIVSITSGVVTKPVPDMVLSAGARAGLTAVLKALASEVAADNVTINGVLPERIATDRMNDLARAQARARQMDVETAHAALIEHVPAGRFGKPAEIGALCAFLCSELAGFITGENIRCDGGAYPGLL